MISLSEFLPEMIATIIGVALGGMGALYNSRRQFNEMKRKRARIFLKNLESEIKENMQQIEAALPIYLDADHGRSFFLGTIAWSTATTRGDLADVLGMELADLVENQYRIFFKIRYYVDLMTRLWFTTPEADGRGEIQQGFNHHIVSNLQAAMAHLPEIQRAIDEAKQSMEASESKTGKL